MDCAVILMVCTEHGSDSVVFCAKYQNGRVSEIDVMDEWVFAIFEFKKTFIRMSYIGTVAWVQLKLSRIWLGWGFLLQLYWFIHGNLSTVKMSQSDTEIWKQVLESAIIWFIYLNYDFLLIGSRVGVFQWY